MTSKAVNRPTDTKVKEADVNAKLQLFGIYSGTHDWAVALNRRDRDAHPRAVAKN